MLAGSGSCRARVVGVRAGGPKLAAFTIIELLVVVSVLVLLIALLVPALNKSRDTAKRAVCLSNLRQWGMIGMLYARDNSGRLAPAKTWGFYFFSTTHRNLGAYYLSEHAADKKLLFCPSAPTGFINYDPGHHGFGLEDHRPFWDGPNSIFTGSYRAGSYQSRAVSAQYDFGLPNDPKTNNWKHNQNVPSYQENDDLNQSVKILRADSHTALVTDVFGLARGYAGQQYFTIGHDFVYNTLYGDGSATGVDCREAPFILLQQNPHFGHLEFLDIFDR